MYQFADTTPSEVANQLPTEAVAINDVFIEDTIKGFRTLQVIGRELIPTEIDSVNMGRDGEREVKSRKPSRIITVVYELNASDAKDFREKFNQLNELLDQNQVAFSFNDEFDKYFIGSKTAIDEVPPGLNTITSSFDIYCAKPFKYSKEEKTFTFAEPDFRSQPESYTEGQTWFVEEGHQVTVTSDYKGKSTGDLVGNPNRALRNVNTALVAPSVNSPEFTQGGYSGIAELDGNVYSMASNVWNQTEPGLMPQLIFPFDMLGEAKRTFNGAFDGLSEAEQFSQLKKIVLSFRPSVYARGSGSSGNMCSLKLWSVATNAWVGNVTNTTAELKQLYFSQQANTFNSYVSEKGILNVNLYAAPTDGNTPNTIHVDYSNNVITFNNPHTGKLLRATKSSDTFNMADWEVYEPEQIITIENNGTYQTPVDIHAKFASHATSIGFVGPNILIQLGDTESSDVPKTPMSELLLIDKMQPSSKGRWQANIAQPRWRRDDSEYQSKVMGSVTWLADYVRATSFGGKVPEDEKEYWKGPSLSWLPGQSLENPETMSWFAFEPTSSGKKRLQQKGLYEINMYDEDNNSVMGFEMRDNANNSDKISYSFFVGDFEIFKGDLPKKYWKEGFLGFVVMRKKGSEFFFQLYRTRVNKKNAEVQEWTSGPKTYTNNTIAGLKAHRFDYWMSTWGNSPAVNMQMAHVQVRKYNTIDANYEALTFVEGDELFVEGATNHVYVNGGRLDKMRVLGSDQLMIAHPGATEVQVTTDGTFEYLRLGLGERYL